MELYFNKDIFKTIYLDEYKEKKRVIIDNIFTNKFSDLLLKYVEKIPKEKWLLCCVYNGDKKYENYDNLRNKKVNDSVIKKAQDTLLKNQFCFVFYKTLLVNKPLNMMEYNLKKIFSGQEFIDYINYLSNENITKLNDIFISKYSSRCFLSPHCDVNNGKIAITIYLSKNWKPEYGGVLHFLNQNRTEIIDSIIPKSNRMSLFSIPNLTGVPHFVSHNNTFKNRYTITMWFS